MIIVWIVEEHVEYEGSGVVGVYEHEEAAKTYAHELWARKRRTDDKITVTRWVVNDPVARVMTFMLQHEKRPYHKPLAPTTLPSETTTAYTTGPDGKVTKTTKVDDE